MVKLPGVGGEIIELGCVIPERRRCRRTQKLRKPGGEGSQTDTLPAPGPEQRLFCSHAVAQALTAQVPAARASSQPVGLSEEVQTQGGRCSTSPFYA